MSNQERFDIEIRTITDSMMQTGLRYAADCSQCDYSFTAESTLAVHTEMRRHIGSPACRARVWTATLTGAITVEQRRQHLAEFGYVDEARERNGFDPTGVPRQMPIRLDPAEERRFRNGQWLHNSGDRDCSIGIDAANQDDRVVFYQTCAYCGVTIAAGSQEELNAVANMHVLQEHAPQIFGERGPEPMLPTTSLGPSYDAAWLDAHRRRREAADPRAVPSESWLDALRRRREQEPLISHSSGGTGLFNRELAVRQARELAFGPSQEFSPPDRLQRGVYVAHCRCGVTVEANTKEALYDLQRLHLVTGHSSGGLFNPNRDPLTGETLEHRIANERPAEPARKRIIKANPRLQK